tara:strand:- start:3692 stop:4549 length:858 start_codon:yes stop_codon:yes gene_type:complete
MSKKPFLTVGLPFYNANEFLKYAIQSTLNQSFSDFELILLNDGSTDSSLEIARSFKDDRIVVISDGDNKGLAYRLNQISQLANGKYLARMDSDDIMHVDRLKIQFEYLSLNENIDLLGSNAFVIDNNNKIYGKMFVLEKPSLIEHVFSNQCFIHPTVTGKTKWFKDNPYNISAIRMEDAELWSRTITTASFENLNKSLLYYRQAGTPYLSKYLKSQKGFRKLIYSNGNKKFKLILYSYLKSLIFIFISVLRLQNYFFKKRHNNISVETISEEQMSLEKSILKKIN